MQTSMARVWRRQSRGKMLDEAVLEQRYSRLSARCHSAMPVSADRAAPIRPAHAREKPASRLGRGKSRETRTLRWREMDSNYWYRGSKAVDCRSIPGIAGYWRARKRYHMMVQPLFFCALNHSIEPGWGTV